MKQKNAYFYLNTKEDGVYIHLIPETEGGLSITTDEITSYLSKVKINDYDIKTLHTTVISLVEETEIKLSNGNMLPIMESVTFRISEDRKTAYAKWFPPSVGGKLLDEEDIKSSLTRENIKYGVQNTAITDFMRERCYNTEIVIAKGLDPVEGKSAEIKYYFQTDKTLKPKHNEDGSVDFHQLDMISHVNKDQLLAELIPANAGVPGIDVNGNIIRPQKVVNNILRHGNNIYLSEDGLKMYTKVSGHVELTDGKVFVSDTYEVLADVDTSTGDITYDGNVHVKGNVRTGFTVRAKGDIIVDGVVEGAELHSDGQIILKRGIQGMNRGLLQAKGNIFSKFIESSTVKSGGYVDTEAILHSKVYAKTDVIVSGKKGFVTGGEIKAGSMIRLKTAGSTMGTTTVLEVGVDPTLVDAYHDCEVEIVQLQEAKDKLVQVLTLFKKKVVMGEKISADKLQYLQKLSQQNTEIEKKLEPLMEKYMILQEQMEENINGKVIVENMAYSGVRISIGSVIYIIKNTEHHCQFIKDKADIRVLGLN
ncbi:DUF342 domain-containing protein [Anaerosporobacter faecicola]|uniref:DUF342 domain-containing protein n=1 Tax=Anaerosporobacter faecicola TaxID=2718714 RepID=UPI0014387C9E|nr:FapA family protein [Anaerosporobacter faecicola]